MSLMAGSYSMTDILASRKVSSSASRVLPGNRATLPQAQMVRLPHRGDESKGEKGPHGLHVSKQCVDTDALERAR
jgi:hypothetical protein